MFRILVAENDEDSLRTLSRALVKNGYDVKTAASGEAVLDLTEREYFDAIISEVMLPRLDGFTLVRLLRTGGISIPIMLISESGGYEYMRQCFVSGADDYMIKPVNTNELLLRLGALLRRTQRVSERVRTIGSTTVDYDAMTVSYGEKSIMLPLKEFQLLFKLCTSPGRIITRQQIMDDIWGYDNNADTHTVDVHMLDSVLNRFGDSVLISSDATGFLLADVITEISPDLFTWLFRLGGRVRITSPEYVCNEYKNYLLSQLTEY